MSVHCTNDLPLHFHLCVKFLEIVCDSCIKNVLIFLKERTKVEYKCSLYFNLSGYVYDCFPFAECPASTLALNLPSDLSCHIPDFCTGIECCFSVGILKRSFQMHLFIDTCSNLFSVGIEKYVNKVSLIDYEWGTTKAFSLAGALRVMYALARFNRRLGTVS